MSKLDVPVQDLKRRSDFDMFQKHKGSPVLLFNTDSSGKNQPQKKARNSMSASPVKRRESFKRSMYRLVANRHSTKEVDNEIKSIDEESKNSSNNSSLKLEERRRASVSISQILSTG